jgi:hypothetical protein
VSAKKVATPVLPLHVFNQLDERLKGGGGARASGRAAPPAASRPSAPAAPQPSVVVAPSPAPPRDASPEPPVAALLPPPSQTAIFAAALAPEPELEQNLVASDPVRRRSTPLYRDVVARLSSQDEGATLILKRLDSLLGLTDSQPPSSARPAPGAADAGQLRAIRRPPRPVHSEPVCGSFFSCFAGGGAEE